MNLKISLTSSLGKSSSSILSVFKRPKSPSLTTSSSSIPTIIFAVPVEPSFSANTVPPALAATFTNGEVYSVRCSTFSLNFVPSTSFVFIVVSNSEFLEQSV